ncbi:nitronate monooxygenase, partial [Devosia sp.]|uniref:nitronate monooxygenase n=1 Tax=Devosia sp. TaxID=1871048 RepID=UPI001AC9654D
MKDLADNPLCHMLGCSRPIVLAGMGGVARSELVAAVAAAGGFGFLGMVRESPELIAAEVGRLRRLGIDRFGVNIIPAATGSDLLARQVETLLALRVPAVTLFWDIDTRLVRRLREAGILVVYQVGSVAEAVDAERAGAQVIIAQGREAGGHVRGATPLQSLLPAVAGAVQVPVLAAGGLSTGGDLIAALSLGAEGIVLGTALLAAEESFAHDHHKHRLLEAKAGDTLLTETFHINWPHGARVRVLASDVTAGKRGREVEGERVVIGDEDGRPIYLFSTDSPLRSTTGDL